MINKNSKDYNSDSKIIAESIFYMGVNFSDIAFKDDDPKKDKTKEACWRIMIKLAKVVDEINCFNNNKLMCEQRLYAAVKRGIAGIPTLELEKNLEDFLTQAKGALDVFAKQFLGAMFSYPNKWYHNKIIKHLEKQNELDKKVVEVIKNLLNEAWDGWLENFLKDRNLHHQNNLGLSLMSIVDNRPFMKLIRCNGDEVTDVIAYLQLHWNLTFWLIERMIRFSFWAVRPNLKVIFLSNFKSCLEESKEP